MRKILERAKEIIINPKGTWTKIKHEPTNIKNLYINYAAPLALIPAVASLIGMTLIGLRLPHGVVRAPFIDALVGGLISYAMNLLVIFLIAWVIKLIAPAFSSKADLGSALKLIVYAMTPAWLVGVFSIVPGLGILSVLGLYGVYLLVVGLPVMMETPKKKVPLYTIAILLLGFVISFVLSLLLISTVYGPMYMRIMEV